MKRPGGGPSGAPKRTRIVDPAESSRGSSSRGGGSGDDTAGGDGDQFLDGDITEANRGARKREKRALKDTDGYGSDSSDDEEGVVPSRRPGAKEDEDEDMDMFADEPKDKEDKEKKEGKSKDKEFMALDDVEGQEFARPKPEEDSDSEDEGKKKGAGLDGDMGELTPFNMKAEMQEGRFSKDGETYEENSKDPHDRHDNWLDSLDKDAIKKARRAHRERERVERERQDAEDDADATGAEREQSLMRGLIPLMERGETVLEAMQRLGTEASKKEKEAAATAGRKKKSWAERQKERKEAAR
jgi:CD2 antigen cytoplasmic tail-binding protein 2